MDLWLSRYQSEGIGGLIDRSHAAPREQVSGPIRARLLAASRMSPPADTGLSHWSSRAMAAFIQRTEGVYVSHHYVAKFWRENGLKPVGAENIGSVMRPADISLIKPPSRRVRLTCSGGGPGRSSGPRAVVGRVRGGGDECCNA